MTQAGRARLVAECEKLVALSLAELGGEAWLLAARLLVAYGYGTPP